MVGEGMLQLVVAMHCFKGFVQGFVWFLVKRSAWPVMVRGGGGLVLDGVGKEVVVVGGGDGGGVRPSKARETWQKSLKMKRKEEKEGEAIAYFWMKP